MNDRQARYLRAKAIVSAADELPEAARTAFVARECAGDAALATEVAWMQQALASETTQRARAWAMPDPPERAGEEFTAADARGYRIVRKLGQGGMGVVYLADRAQDGFAQRVALKLLRRAGDESAAARERFGRERALLARLEHPGIARLLDGGALSDGQPFLAIEYVEGVHIDRWCRQQAPGLRGRLALFLQVCDAVAYAHRHLVIHRDLKPANILVTADGRTKLLDFGVARLLEAQGEAPLDPTELGQHALTLAYASPEQIRRQPLSVATDVYSLGVVLYQLVSGAHPFAGHNSPFEVSRAIVAGQVLPPSRAPHAAGGPAPAHRVDADLDAIVMKAMRLDAEARYATVDALRADLQRWLERRPVAARRGHWGYRARRFLQRHRWPIAAGGAVAGSLALGLAASLVALDSARTQQQLAEQRQRQLERTTAFQQGVLESVDIDAMGHAMVQAQHAALQRMLGADDPVLAERAEAVFAQLPATDLARDLLDRYVVSHALSRVQRDFRDTPELAADVRHSMARVLLAIGQYAPAVSELERVLGTRSHVLRHDDRRIAAVRVDLGQATYRQGDLAAAAAHFEAASAQGAALPEGDPLRLTIDSGRARVQAARGRLGEALARQDALLATWTGRLPESDPALLELRRDAVNTLIRLSRREEAGERMQALLPLYRRRFGEDAPQTLDATLTLAEMVNTLNQYEVSLALAEEVARQRARRLGRDHPETLRAAAVEGANRVRLAQREPAFTTVEASMRDLLQRQERVLGEEHPQTLTTMTELVRLLYKQHLRGKSEQAIVLQRRILSVRQRTLGDAHPDAIYSRIGLANLLISVERYDDARAMARAALDDFERVLPGHRYISATWDVLGRVEDGAGRLDQARRAHARALALRAASNGPIDAHTIESASRLYVILHRLGDRVAQGDVRSLHLDPVLALDPATLNASMLDIQESARLALAGVSK